LASGLLLLKTDRKELFLQESDRGRTEVSFGRANTERTWSGALGITRPTLGKSSTLRSSLGRSG
jgi:hypothetical protein